MQQQARRASFADEGRVALSVRLPRAMHRRMREIALRRDVRVNDLYQDTLQEYIESGQVRPALLFSPPASAQPVTLWLAPEFMAKFRTTIERHDWLPGSLVLTAVVEAFGLEDLSVAG
ncbi:hypothetical protein [Caulobacter hibisci]|uniref:Uncharacterized protein n=1 Tax=Caulobacter hibisci TaxID=2035993 RepID=A0ABS0SVE2_9CAUL|nr:hypothetical protein [Caulobacter hibisci]MBI1683612.1 hypothetical protein [Caulobacter hibisci]